MTHKGTAVITDAMTTIGRAFADQLAGRGYDLILIAANRDVLLTLAAALTDNSGRSVEVLDADLAVPGDLVRIEDLLRRDASITMLVNHHDLTADGDISMAIALGVTAPVRLSYALASGFVARGVGAVINLVPMARRQGSRVEAARGAFVLALSHAMRPFADPGVRVQAVLYADARPDRRQSAWAIADEALRGFDSGAVVTLAGGAARIAWKSVAVAGLELHVEVAHSSVNLMSSRLLH